METNWIIIALVFVGVVALIIYLIVRNAKDKDDVTTFLNKTEVEEKPEGEEQRRK
jgi:uncharacterized membrane protein